MPFADQAVRVFKALGDTTRYRIVCALLAHGELGCSELAKLFDLSSPALSHHYRVLENAGLIRTRKEGTCVYLCARREALERVVPGFVRAHVENASETLISS